MGWPKGKPRKGHINKDGSTPKRWGSLLAARKAVQRLREEPIEKKRRGRPPKDPSQKTWRTKLTNKGYDPCPRCEFPEAYGGYCPECGWMQKIGIGKW